MQTSPDPSTPIVPTVSTLDDQRTRLRAIDGLLPELGPISDQVIDLLAPHHQAIEVLGSRRQYQRDGGAYVTLGDLLRELGSQLNPEIVQTLLASAMKNPVYCDTFFQAIAEAQAGSRRSGAGAAQSADLPALFAAVSSCLERAPASADELVDQIHSFFSALAAHQVKGPVSTKAVTYALEAHTLAGVGSSPVLSRHIPSCIEVLPEGQSIEDLTAAIANIATLASNCIGPKSENVIHVLKRLNHYLQSLVSTSRYSPAALQEIGNVLVGVIANAGDRPIAAMRGIHACRKALGEHFSVESMRAIGVRLESFGQHWEWALKFAIPQVIERFGKSFELSTFDKALEILAEGTAKVGYNAPVLLRNALQETLDPETCLTLEVLQTTIDELVPVINRAGQFAPSIFGAAYRQGLYHLSEFPAPRQAAAWASELVTAADRVPEYRARKFLRADVPKGLLSIAVITVDSITELVNETKSVLSFSETTAMLSPQPMPAHLQAVLEARLPLFGELSGLAAKVAPLLVNALGFAVTESEFDAALGYLLTITQRAKTFAPTLLTTALPSVLACSRKPLTADQFNRYLNAIYQVIDKAGVDSELVLGASFAEGLSVLTLGSGNPSPQNVLDWGLALREQLIAMLDETDEDSYEESEIYFDQKLPQHLGGLEIAEYSVDDLIGIMQDFA